jgi:hypothetical protein
MPFHLSRRAAGGLAVVAALAALAPTTTASPRHASYGRTTGERAPTLLLGGGGGPQAFAATKARQGTYGGMTSDGAPIVLTTDAKAQKLTGAVLKIDVPDESGAPWLLGGKAKVVPAPKDLVSGSPLTDVLAATRNARGRFVTQLVRLGATDEALIVMTVDFKGTLKLKGARGTIKGTVEEIDPATGQVMETYKSPTVKWAADRAAGRIYGGSTADSLPVVIKLDPRHRKVADLWMACVIDDSNPPGWWWSSNEFLGGFPLKQGRFGDRFTYSEEMSDGTTQSYEWNIAGRVTSKAATGTMGMTVKVVDNDPPLTFTMPSTRFSATSG